MSQGSACFIILIMCYIRLHACKVSNCKMLHLRQVENIQLVHAQVF